MSSSSSSSQLSDAQLEKDIRAYFKNGGEGSLKAVRKHLESLHSCSLAKDKKRISTIANDILAEEEEQEENENEQAEEKPTQKTNEKKSSTTTTTTATSKATSKANSRFASVFAGEGADDDDDSSTPAKKKLKIGSSSDNNNGKSNGNSSLSSSSSSYQTNWRTDRSGEKFIDLAAKKRLSITNFKGRQYVNIREFYDKDGQMLPTKKGIALDAAAWKILKDNIQMIDEALGLK